MVEVSTSYENGGGYSEKWEGSGAPEEIQFKGQKILSKGKEGTYCSGFTFAVVMKTAENHPAFQDKKVEQIRKFQQEWYGNTPESREKQCVSALVNLGVGKEVKPAEAQPGDFMQLWRTKSGHSTVFLGWEKDAKGEVVGVRYRSSQGSTSGIGEKREYFKGVEYVDEDGKKHNGEVDPDRVYFGRMASGE